MSQYKFLKLLGSVGQGEVWLAKHVLSDLKYAIKIIDKTEAENFFTDTEERFSEAQLLVDAARSSLRNILKVVQVAEDQCKLYLVTELHLGGSLLDWYDKILNLNTSDRE